METHKNTNGMKTLLENWWFVCMAIAVYLTFQVIAFFENLCGIPWIYFFVASFTLMMCGAVLIGYAKLPVYRSGRFFTFGLNSVPVETRRYYRSGWRVFLFGVLLSLCLLLSKP